MEMEMNLDFPQKEKDKFSFFFFFPFPSLFQGPFELQQPNRKWIREDTLVSTSSKNKRRVFLFTDMLLVTTPVKNGYQIKYITEWWDTEVIDEPENGGKVYM